MSEQFNLDKDKFLHTSRHVELVVVKDRDVMAFYADTIPSAMSEGMQVWRDDGLQSLLYQSTAPYTATIHERVLLWGRLSGSQIVSAFRWVPYIDSEDSDEPNIKPLREVFAPRVVYDRTSNMLHLWFWTNVNYAYNGTVYDESELYYIGTQGYDTAIAYQGTDPETQLAKRVLCYASGQMGHYYVRGGLQSGWQGVQAQGDDAYDLVPIFTRPKIINFDTSATGVQGPGIITDGWYLSAGGGEYDGPFKCAILSSDATYIGCGEARDYSGSYYNRDIIKTPDGVIIEKWYWSEWVSVPVSVYTQGWVAYDVDLTNPLLPTATLTYYDFYDLPTDTDDHKYWVVACTQKAGGVFTHCTQQQFGDIVMGAGQGADGLQGPQGTFPGKDLVTPWRIRAISNSITGVQVDGTIETTVCECQQGAGGMQGPQGYDGTQGNPGPQGNDGTQGNPGPQGYDGTQGNPGPQGYDGTQGNPGPQGNDGTQGNLGLQGNDGTQGNDGFQGVQGAKPAIVKVGDGYRELDCIESPEVLFFDKTEVEVGDSTSVFAVDPMFVEVCEPGTVKVVSATPSVPVVFGAKMLDSRSFEIRVPNGPGAVEFTVMLCGVRKGFAGRRFAERTAEEYERNTEFWKRI